MRPGEKPNSKSGPSAYLKFLGTAGARFVVAKQLRSSAGLYLEAGGVRVLIDPGPGTIVRLAASQPRLDPEKMNGVILTHGHIDHANDVNIIIDAMTEGGIKRRGWLFAPRECLEGEKAVVLNYLKSYLEHIVILEPEREYSLGKLTWKTSGQHRHGVETYGLIFDINGKKLALVADTKFFPELVTYYRGTHWLVVNVVRDTPFDDPSIQHLVLADARRLIEEIRPEITVLTHFGMRMLRAKPWELARRLEKEFNQKVIAAADGFQLPLE